MKNSFVREGKRSEFGIDEWKLYFGENGLRDGGGEEWEWRCDEKRKIDQGVHAYSILRFENGYGNDLNELDTVVW